jgi:hypothetical protein
MLLIECVQRLKELLHIIPRNVLHRQSWSLEMAWVANRHRIPVRHFLCSGSRVSAPVTTHHRFPLRLCDLEFSHLKTLPDAHPVHRLFVTVSIP